MKRLLSSARRTRSASRPMVVSIAAVGLMTAATAAHAQYFGRNKVQYRSFDFQVLQTPTFDVYYYPEEEEAARMTARMAERWNERLSRVLDYRFEDEQPLILYASHPHFRQTNVVSSQIGESTGGLTEAFKRRVVLPLAGSLGATDHVLGHELVHAFQYAITGGPGIGGGASPPLWFIEGMAEYLSIGALDPHTAMWMRDAVESDDLPAISDLASPKYFPYRWGHALWSYVAGRWGDGVVGRLLRAAGSGRSGVAEAFEDELGIELETLSEQWHATLRSAYEPLARRQAGPENHGRPLITASGSGGQLNVAPALSPDGSRVAFLSERDLFSIDLYVADAVTGEVQVKLSETATDPHFDSLQFVDSSGAWSPDGARFAVTAVSAGRAVLTIYDVERGEVAEEHRLGRVDQAFNPTWSPDGEQVAFVGIRGGLLDLWRCELSTGRLERLTDDAYAELQPAWSPDGERIAFATDRFTTDLASLDSGDYRLALLELETGRVEPLPFFAGSKHLDPAWDGDGYLYFVSDRLGVSNVYRLDPGSGTLAQLTDLYTGVSGITAESPALSVASRGERLVYTAYESGEHRLYAVDQPARVAMAPVAPASGTRTAAVLPPRVRADAEVGPLRRDPDLGLPEPIETEAHPYHASLSLDYVAQPQIGVGVDRFGSFVGGGSALYFSDMLGHHRLGGTLQVDGRLRDFTAVASYENRESRWNWGGFLHRVPYRSLGFATRVGEVDGEGVIFEETIRFRQIERGGGVALSYPFSSATRVELLAGYRNLAYDNEIESLGFSLATGRLVIDETTELPASPDLHIATSSVALVRDTSVFGATSPILGERARLEIAPQVGSLDYTSVLADYRRYAMPVRPVTLALRLLHFGRYGAGGSDSRLAPLYIGYPSLVRGYDIDSFDSQECVADATGSCPVFDRLQGSRMLVANAELRFPPLGLFSRESYYGPLPIEALIFYDTGVAWTSEQEPELFGGARERVSSVGFGARLNLFGYAVLELDLVKPVDRPHKGWHWQFAVVPGF